MTFEIKINDDVGKLLDVRAEYLKNMFQVHSWNGTQAKEYQIILGLQHILSIMKKDYGLIDGV